MGKGKKIKAIDPYDKRGDLKPEKKEVLPRPPKRSDNRLSRAEQEFLGGLEKTENYERERAKNQKREKQLKERQEKMKEDAKARREAGRAKWAASKGAAVQAAPKGTAAPSGAAAAPAAKAKQPPASPSGPVIPSFGDASDSDEGDDAVEAREHAAVMSEAAPAPVTAAPAFDHEGGETAATKKKKKKKRKRFGEMREGETFTQFNERIKQETRETLVETYQNTRRKKQKLNEFMNKKKLKKKEKEKAIADDKVFEDREKEAYRDKGGGGQGGMEPPQFGEQAIQPPRFKRLPGEKVVAKRKVVLSDCAPILQRHRNAAGPQVIGAK